MKILAVLIINLFLFSSPLIAQKRMSQKIMAKKLKASQSLLEGLVKEDYKLISKSAEQLLKIGKSEKWYKMNSKRYRHYADSFENAAQNMLDQSSKKNLEGVAMSYIGMTFSCMQCHNEIREGRSAK